MSDETKKPARRRAPPRAKPAPIPLHPLFALAANRDPLEAPIETIDVFRVTPKGGRSMLRWYPADQLPDEMALEAACGPGTYHLIGRDIGRTMILRRVDITVGDVDDEPDEPARVQPAPAASQELGAGGLLTMLMRDMQESRKETIAMVTAFAERGERQMEGVLKVVTTALGARADDALALAKAAASGKGGGLTLEQVKEIQHDAIAMAEAAREQAKEEIGATENEVSEIEFVGEIAKAFNAATNKEQKH